MIMKPQQDANCMRHLTVALVQDAPVLFNTPDTLALVKTRVQEAQASGAQLVVFPEAFVGGYPKGMTFGVTVGTRSDEGRNDYTRYWHSAIEEYGPEWQQLGEIARDHSVFLVMGVVERAGGTLYCTVAFFGPDGAYLGKHRKLVPTALERVIWGQGDASTLPMIDTPYGRLGSLICWENYMPLLRTYYYQQNIQLYCAVTVDDRDNWLATMRHIALEGRCFVFSCCQFLPKSSIPSDLSITLDQDPLIRGGSCIVNPLGQFILEPLYGQAAVCTAIIDLDDIPRGKMDLDAVGHYARSDIFTLQFHGDRA